MADVGLRSGDRALAAAVIRVAERSWLSLTARQAVAVSTAIAALTCLTWLGYQPLSWDEAVTASAAAREPLRLAALLAHTELRLPSAVAAVGTVAATVALTAHWFGRCAGRASPSSPG
jgi:hypothetical protein